MAAITEALGWIMLTIIKFVVSPSIMISSGKSYLYVLSITIIGSLIGILIFYNLGGAIFSYFDKFKKKEKKLTKNNIKVLRVISRRGLIGLLILAPLLSIPGAAIIASKFFSHTKHIQLYLLAIFWIWAFILTTISHYIYSSI